MSPTSVSMASPIEGRGGHVEPTPGAIIEEALEALHRGWVLVALAGKRPPRGRRRSIITKEADARVHAALGGNFGVLPKRSQLVIIDIDPRNGGDLADVSRYPATLMAATGSGGLHLYFNYPQGHALKGKERNDDGTLRPGTDVLTESLAVMAPGFFTTTRNVCLEYDFMVDVRYYYWINDLPISDLDNATLVRLTKENRKVDQIRPEDAAGVDGKSKRRSSSHGLAVEVLRVPDLTDSEVGRDLTPALLTLLSGYVENAPTDDSVRDYFLACSMRSCGVSFQAFVAYIGSLPRRKKEKTHDLVYLQRTWDNAQASSRTGTPLPPSPEVLLSLSERIPAPVLLDAGSKPEETRSGGTKTKLDARVEKSLRLVVGFLIWKHASLGHMTFQQSVAEVARVTGLTEKTVGLRIQDLGGAGLIEVGEWYRAGGDYASPQPRWMDTSALIAHTPAGAELRAASPMQWRSARPQAQIATGLPDPSTSGGSGTTRPTRAISAEPTMPQPQRREHHRREHETRPPDRSHRDRCPPPTGPLCAQHSRSTSLWTPALACRPSPRN